MYPENSGPSQSGAHLSGMNLELPVDLHLQIRKIRDIEVWRSDLLPLIYNNGTKSPASLLMHTELSFNN